VPDPASGKVSIVGAGSVGTAIAYACLIRGSAGALALFDTNAKKVHAEVLDLNHGSQFVPSCPVTGSDDAGVTAGSSIVVVTAGAKQKPGQSRLELAATNVAMARSLTPQLLVHSPGAVVIFVTNPVDLVTYAAAGAVDLPAGRVFGSGTVLDSSRFRYLIARRAGVNVGNVCGAVTADPGRGGRGRAGSRGDAGGQGAAGSAGLRGDPDRAAGRPGSVRAVSRTGPSWAGSAGASSCDPARTPRGRTSSDRR